MFKWLHKFFYSDDEVVKLAAGCSESEAEMYRELLQNNGIPAMTKNMNFLAVEWGRPIMPTPNNFDIFVKQSDLERAIDILGSLLGHGKLARAAAETRRERRRFRRGLKP